MSEIKLDVVDPRVEDRIPEDRSADEIAASRPPDRITYGEWEPDPASRTEHRDWVAHRTEGFLFRTVTAWREVLSSEHTHWRRKVIEHWDEPEKRVPISIGAIIATAQEGDDIDVDAALSEFRVYTIPARHVARSHWERRAARDL